LPGTLSTASHRDQSSPAITRHLRARLRRHSPYLQHKTLFP
jgi:hypothetical protein